ncbi:uncharacterized protein LOC134530162 [Bacillus rossius redtenbacheri]|uniref:uncharacterized protein LOC134530162 n=1 Tax=Bacillus rossius redtenbacheri TaxID=93214 RepID=UPI002FDD728F
MSSTGMARASLSLLLASCCALVAASKAPVVLPRPPSHPQHQYATAQPGHAPVTSSELPKQIPPPPQPPHRQSSTPQYHDPRELSRLIQLILVAPDVGGDTTRWRKTDYTSNEV